MQNRFGHTDNIYLGVNVRMVSSAFARMESDDVLLRSCGPSRLIRHPDHRQIPPSLLWPR